MRTVFLLVGMFLLSMVYVQAEIEVSGTLEEYGLDDEITVDVLVHADHSFQGILTVHLICEDYSLEYFVAPLFMEKKGDEKMFEVDPFVAFNKMVGTCIIDAYTNSILGSPIDKASSEPFKVIFERDIVDEDAEEEIEKSDDEEVEEVEIKEEKSEKEGNKGLFSMLLLVVTLLALGGLFVYSKTRNKNSFNRGWKLK